MIRQTSQNLRPNANPKSEECETLLTIRLREAFEKAKAKQRKPERT